MMTPKLRLGLLIGGFGLVTALAVAGWTRKPSEPVAPYATNFAAANPDAQPATPCVDTTNYDAAPPAYVTNRYVRSARPSYPQSTEPAGSRAVPARHGRSTGKSVAIVAGSSGVGAAIGGLAGGGKGAGIGALAGGAAGFAYDRLTHNH